MNVGYTAFGEDQFTATLTNTGILDLGEQLNELVDDAYFILGEQKTKPINIAMSTFKNSAKLMVSTVFENEGFTKKLADLLDSYGVSIRDEAAASSKLSLKEHRLAS